MTMNGSYMKISVASKGITIHETTEFVIQLVVSFVISIG